MITTIDNSPVKFLGSGEVTHNELGALCNCRGQTFEQRVQCDDSSNFQVGLTELNGIEQVLNGGFTTADDWTFGNNWFQDGFDNEADHVPSGGASDLTQDVVGVVGCYYKLVFTVLNYVAGTVTPKFGTNVLASQSANGTFTLYGFFEGNETLTFSADDPFDGSITNVSVKEMSQVGFGIRNNITNQYLFIDVDNANVIYFEDEAQVNFDWVELAIGYICPDVCIQICLFDIAAEKFGPELILNGGFDVDADWTKNAWLIVGGRAVLTDDPASSITQSPTIEVGVTYRTKYEVVTFAGIAVVVVIAVGGGTGTGRAAEGIFVENVLTIATSGVAIFGAAPFPGEIAVDNVSVKKIIDIEAGIIDGSIQPVTCSENYHLKNTWDCTILLEWTNNDNAFGFNYTDFVFNQALRISGKLRNTTSEKINKTPFTNSRGEKKIIFSQVFRVEDLIIDEMPEYLHRSLDIGVEHDTFTIDNVAYVNEEDEYAPNWRRSSLLASVIVSVKEKVQFLENNNC